MADKGAAMGTEMSLRACRRLLAGAAERLATVGDDARAQLGALIEFQVECALAEPLLLGEMLNAGLPTVRDPASASSMCWAVRRYVEMWVAVLSRVHPMADDAICRARAHAVLGLIESAHRSVGRRDHSTTGALLREMAWSAATA